MLFVTSANAQEHTGTFDPSKVKGPAKGVPNEVLVLGTPHFESLSASFKLASLRALDERLVGWKPGIIAIEALPGTQCAILRQYPQRYEEAVQRYCRWGPAPARIATGLDVPA